jgi:repressor LexA
MYPTRKQKIILDAVQQHIAETGQPPTLQEIAQRCGLSSLATVHRHLALLQERGLLRRRKSRRRGIELKPAARAALAVTVPLAGTISAGRPIEAVQGGEEIQIPRELARHPKTFALRVRGDSMRDEQIHDGDFVVLEEREHARDGDVVVALIDGREATLKTLKKERGRIRLQPANASVAPIYVRPNDLRIQGVVTGLIRIYD